MREDKRWRKREREKEGKRKFRTDCDCAWWGRRHAGRTGAGEPLALFVAEQEPQFNLEKIDGMDVDKLCNVWTRKVLNSMCIVGAYRATCS